MLFPFFNIQKFIKQLSLVNTQPSIINSYTCRPVSNQDCWETSQQKFLEFSLNVVLFKLLKIGQAPFKNNFQLNYFGIVT